MTSLAKRITDERLRRGLGQLTLARLLMVSPGVLCGWEQGRALPPSHKVEHMERLGLNLTGAPRTLDPTRHTLNQAELDIRALCGVPRPVQDGYAVCETGQLPASCRLLAYILQ